MDAFPDAPLAAQPGKIPEEPLSPRKGRVIIRRAPEGASVQDVSIFPSRQTREAAPRPDGAYGTALRMFQPQRQCYDAVYACRGAMIRPEFRKEGGRLVGTCPHRPEEQRICSEPTGLSFCWQNITWEGLGRFRLNADVYGKRA